MTKLASSLAAVGDDGLDSALVIADLRRQNAALQAELDELQPVISSAVLAATAFRLRDHQALTGALRLLVRAVDRLERRRAAD
jgi:hypothetical protein